MEAEISASVMFLAGLSSVLMPCILPILPILLTGTADDHKLRPLLVVLGLVTSFNAIVILTSLSINIFAGNVFFFQRAVSGVVIVFGIMMMLNINVFKYITAFSGMSNYNPKGILSGYLIGLSLGLIWMPCTGTQLTTVSLMLAKETSLKSGLFMLCAYTAGLAAPMLLISYSSHGLRKQIIKISGYQKAVNIISGLVLVSYGGYMLYQTFNFGMPMPAAG
ncbi:MAG: cytochrome c biogenesis protein CcdA [Gammaproteobacteria bacterium]|nr:MAG: cytochrome c biogenesis protein CcdA [Gammaproteobacteria bacterium]